MKEKTRKIRNKDKTNIIIAWKCGRHKEKKGTTYEYNFTERWNRKKERQARNQKMYRRKAGDKSLKWKDGKTKRKQNILTINNTRKKWKKMEYKAGIRNYIQKTWIPKMWNETMRLKEQKSKHTHKTKEIMKASERNNIST